MRLPCRPGTRHRDRVTDTATLLAAYDEQLRTDAETPSALSVTVHGPLRLVTFARRPRLRHLPRPRRGGRGRHPRARRRRASPTSPPTPTVTRVEWKTRGHDHAPGLHEALVAAGFDAGGAGVDHDGRGAPARGRRRPARRASPCAR